MYSVLQSSPHTVTRWRYCSALHCTVVDLSSSSSSKMLLRHHSVPSPASTIAHMRYSLWSTTYFLSVLWQQHHPWFRAGTLPPQSAYLIILTVDFARRFWPILGNYSSLTLMQLCNTWTGSSRGGCNILVYSSLPDRDLYLREIT